MNGSEGSKDTLGADQEEIVEPRVPLIIDPEFQDSNQKKYKYGIIYLSSVPEGVNVKILREIMDQFGEVGRIYLERGESKKKHPTYLEGWLEFKKKRVAKSVAESLNGTAIQFGRKHSKINGQVWSLKYLHRFKWVDLTEQINHNKAIRDQKRRSEMTNAKKQVDFYQKMTERSKWLKKKKDGDKSELDPSVSNRIKSIEMKQNKPRKLGDELAVAVDEDFLHKIFKRVTD